jgi:hypothetical protein
MLTDSAHHPTDCLSDLAIWILEHGQKVLECLNDHQGKFGFIWSLCDGAESHQRGILLLPVGRLDMHGHIGNHWVHEFIAEKHREPLEAACC